MSNYTEIKVGKYIVRKYNNGTEEWLCNGKVHREDGPAVKYAYGDEEWYKNGIRHREDGPTIKWANGHEMWYKNGKCHREDGPAVKYADGSEYWVLNHKYSLKQEEYRLISISYRINIIYE